MNVRLPRKLAALAKKIRPLNDRVFVKRFEYQHPILAVVGVKLEKGVVVAVGPGKPRRRKTLFRQAMGAVGGQRDLMFEDGDERNAPRHPMPVKVGDVVEFSPRMQIEVEIDGEKLVVIRSGSIYGTSNDSKSEAMLWQESAGHDRKGNFLPGAQTFGVGGFTTK